MQFLRDALQVGQGELAVHRRAQHAAPGVEHLQRLRTGRALGGQVGDHGIGVDRQQAVQGGRFVQRHRLDAGEVLAAAAFHHVAGQRPRAAGKADERHLAVQFAADHPYRVHHVAQFGFHVRHAQLRRVGGAAHGALELRALAFDEVQAQPHRIGDGQDVGEQDGGVQVETAQRLQRHFTGDLRVLRHAQEAAGFLAGGAVLRQVTTGLAHQPYRRAIHGFAAQGAQEAIVLQGSHRLSGGRVTWARPRRGRTSAGIRA